MGMGILVWGTANCVVGWACGRYGLFGLKANIPANTTLNYIGLVLVICGGVLFSHLRPSSTITSRFSSDSPVTHEYVNPSHSDVEEEIDETSNLLQLQAKISKRKRVLGIALSVVSGIFYGVNFVPVIYIQEHTDKFKDASTHGLPYVFSHYSGVFLTTTTMFVVYCIIMKSRPVINNEIVLPAFITGLLWAIGQTFWFVANDLLSQAITFPIISMVPGVCAALWSIFYFREISGRRNLRILSGAILLTLLGATMVGLSKDIPF